MVKKIWKLGTRKPEVYTKNYDGDTMLYIYIRWSDKLGLELKHKFYAVYGTPDEEGNKKVANALVEKIIKRGEINTDCWERIFK